MYLENKKNYAISKILLMVCVYLFLVIERPWESISYFYGLPIERSFAIFLIIISIFHGKFKVSASPTNKWVYGLLVVHFLFAPFSYNPTFSLDVGIRYSKMVVLYLLMLAVADNEKSLKMIIQAFVISTILYAIHSLWEYTNGKYVWRMGISRMVGVGETLSDPNAFGASLVLSLPMAYVLWRVDTGVWAKRFYAIYLILVVICLVLTGSRSATVGFIFLLIIWVLSQKGTRKIVLLVATGICIGGVWSTMPDAKQERIRSIWDENAGPENAHSSAEGRIRGFKAGWEMFKSEPLTGIGAGGRNFGEYRSLYLDGSSEQSHNLLAQVLGGLGVGGLVLFFGMILSISKCCFSVYSNELEKKKPSLFAQSLSRAIIVCLALLLVLGIAGHNFYRPLWLWLAAWAGSLHMINTKSSREYNLCQKSCC